MSDSIRRKTAIDAVTALCVECDADYCGECRVNCNGTEIRDCLDVLAELPPADRPKGECRTCKRSSDYLWSKGEDGTRCPIEEHYALPKNGYCHLYEQI